MKGVTGGKGGDDMGYGRTKTNGSKEIFPNVEDSMGLSKERESRQGRFYGEKERSNNGPAGAFTRDKSAQGSKGKAKISAACQEEGVLDWATFQGSSQRRNKAHFIKDTEKESQG